MKKRYWSIALTYVGAVVGAGFSSGQEIWHFFARHQGQGLIGVVIVGFFFIFVTPYLFSLGYQYRTGSYHQLFYTYLPRSLAVFFDISYIIFLIGSVAVMVAGSGTLFHNLLGYPYYLGILVTIIFILGVLYNEQDSILAVNWFLIPFLIIITIFTLYSYFNLTGWDHLGDLLEISTLKGKWFFDGFLYGSYNLTIAAAVMISILWQEERENIVKGSMLGGFFFLY